MPVYLVSWDSATTTKRIVTIENEPDETREFFEKMIVSLLLEDSVLLGAKNIQIYRVSVDGFLGHVYDSYNKE